MPEIRSQFEFSNIVVFIVPVLLTLLQLKCQGNAYSPFDEEHPITVWFATGCLLVYCLVYAVELGQFSGNAQGEVLGNAQEHPTFVHRFKLLFGSLFIASLASMIFPSSFQPFLYGICIILLVYVSTRSRGPPARDGGGRPPVLCEDS